MKRNVARFAEVIWTLATGFLLAACSWTTESQDNTNAPGFARGNLIAATAKSLNNTSASNIPDVQPATIAMVKPEITEMQLAKTLFENRDGVKAFQIFKKYAATGSAEAEAWLGRCCMHGVGTAVDCKKAYEYFRRAAEKNNPWGVNGLGVCNQYGFGTVVNLQAAKDLYVKAANMNHPLGTLNLARTYTNEKGGFFNPEQAEKFYKKAVELNAPFAKTTYAVFLFSQKRYSDATTLAQASIEEPESMFIMAKCYENGWGVPVNIFRAVELAEAHFKKNGREPWSAEVCYNAGLEEWIINPSMTEFAKRCFKCAADQGHTKSQIIHAVNLLRNGNKTDALKYMRRAADSGHAQAMIETGKMLDEQKDYDAAIRYFILAALDNRTQEEAVSNLSNIYHYKLNETKKGLFWDQKGLELGIAFCRNEIALSELQQNDDAHFAKAAALFAESAREDNEYASKLLHGILTEDYERLRGLADKGNADALLALGIIGCNEEKGHPNVAIGMELLEKAANLNNTRACCILGKIHCRGRLVKKDLKKSLAWYQKGAELGDAESARSAAQMLFYEDELRKNTKLDDIKKIFDRCLKLEVFSVAFEYGEIMEFIAKDLKKAEELYRLAAAHNDARAMLSLHDMLSADDNIDESLSFLQKAVKLENCKADLRMGDIQKIICKQPRHSFMYYLKAHLHGDEVDAPFRMAECKLNGYGCEVDLNCFWKWASIAYGKGCVEVCYLLGSVFRDGKICAKDLKEARKYFEIGVKRGSKQCMKALKEL